MFLGILETGYLDDLTRSKEITMDVFMYKDGVIEVINKLRRDGIYGNIPVLVEQLYTKHNVAMRTWQSWWKNYLLKAGLTDRQAAKYSEEIAMYAAEQCGIILYHTDNAEQKEVKDVYTWQSELFRSPDFVHAVQALISLYSYCERRGFIDSEAVDERDTAYKSITLELRQTQCADIQKTSVKIVLTDKANGIRVEDITI